MFSWKRQRKDDGPQRSSSAAASGVPAAACEVEAVLEPPTPSVIAARPAAAAAPAGSATAAAAAVALAGPPGASIELAARASDSGVAAVLERASVRTKAAYFEALIHSNTALHVQCSADGTHCSDFCCPAVAASDGEEAGMAGPWLQESSAASGSSGSGGGYSEVHMVLRMPRAAPQHAQQPTPGRYGTAEEMESLIERLQDELSLKEQQRQAAVEAYRRRVRRCCRSFRDCGLPHCAAGLATVELASLPRGHCMKADSAFAMATDQRGGEPVARGAGAEREPQAGGDEGGQVGGRSALHELRDRHCRHDPSADGVGCRTLTALHCLPAACSASPHPSLHPPHFLPRALPHLLSPSLPTLPACRSGTASCRRSTTGPCASPTCHAASGGRRVGTARGALWLVTHLSGCMRVASGCMPHRPPHPPPLLQQGEHGQDEPHAHRAAPRAAGCVPPPALCCSLGAPPWPPLRCLLAIQLPGVWRANFRRRRAFCDITKQKCHPRDTPLRRAARHQEPRQPHD